MPSQRPCAAFEPLAPDLDLAALIEATPNFEYVERIHCDMIDHQGIEDFEKLVMLHVIIGGKPLVIEGYEKRLEPWTFGLQWLRDNYSQKVENASDLTKKTNLPLSIGHYLNNMSLLTNQWNSKNYKDRDRQRIYLKDIDCPPLWHDKLSHLIPPALFYLNESTGDLGGPGAVEEPNPHGPGTRKGRAIAQAGDLMSSLPPEMRAENMMCYIGHEGTYTPAHREMCASLGQNIMVETSTGAIEDGKPTKPGSSIWFMTETKDRHVVSEYWLSALGHDIEVEKHFAQINAWKAAPFKTYVVQQRVGDFILIPPLAPHQVWNRGTRTMKVAWNRTTVETLEMALEEALPRARMVCRDEQYKNKAIIYYSMVKYSKLLTAAMDLKQKNTGKPPARIRQLQKDFRRLHALYTKILISESFPPDQEEKKIEFIRYDSNITCSYCRGNIFNRFLTCPSCIAELPNGDEDTYDICMECYAMGRSCRCISKLKWVEQFSWGDLTRKHEQWRRQIIQFEGQVTERSPNSLKVEVERYGKRSLAEICQLELKKRPWTDIQKPAASVEKGDESEEVEVNGEGIVPKKKKRKPRQSEKFKREHKVCHFHTVWEPKWKQIQCSQCEASFCYGTLARAFDMKPQEILAEREWKCPRCRHFCICRTCRKQAGWQMIEPPRIMLGHDTRKVADPRSVESLVDYSQSNISWLQKVGDDGTNDTRRLQKRMQAAEKAKAQKPELGDHYVEDVNMVDPSSDEVEGALLRLAQQENIPIDPALRGERVTDGDSEDTGERWEQNPEEAGCGDDYRSFDHVPPQPQHVIPAGGIIRDAEHAYDATEAITFDYPDPDFDLQTTPFGNQGPPRAQAPSGYEPPLMPAEPGKIEMVHRKRKKSGNGLGKRPYHSPTKAKHHRVNKTKQRKSLVVKLKVGKIRLAQLKKMSAMAQRALRGVEGDDRPVIGSDLRALNVESGAANSPQSAKKIRLEPEDEDDEFTGPRVRKDKPMSVPKPHTLPTRRTRAQNVAYDIPSEGEEFEEISVARNRQSPQTPTRQARSKGERERQSSSQTPANSNVTESSSVIGVDVGPPPEESAVAISHVQSASDSQHGSPAKADGIIPFSHLRNGDTSAQKAVISSPTIDGTIRPLSFDGPLAVPGGTDGLKTTPARTRARVLSGLPAEAKPKQTAPKEPAPKEPAPKQTAPKQPAQKEPAPKQIVPKEATPKQATPNDKEQLRTSSVSEVEKNRRAKLAAMRWAEGGGDDFEVELSSGSEEEDSFIPGLADLT